jgi:hypothetical protein
MFQQLPKQCIDLIYDFASIDWKQKFTDEVVPNISGTFYINYTAPNYPCWVCYKKCVMTEFNRRYVGGDFNRCSYCNVYKKGSNPQPCSYEQFKNLRHSYRDLIRIYKLNTFEKFQKWYNHSLPLLKGLRCIKYNRVYRRVSKYSWVDDYDPMEDY